MKTIYKTIFVIGLGITSLAVSAQKDTTLTRQVLLEREYNPTLQDASKINTTPNIYTPVVKQGNINFVSSTPQIKLENNQLGASAPGDIKTNVDFSKKRGYLILGGGTNGNLDGAAGYRILDSEKDRLDLFGNYDATSGSIKYLDKENYLDEDVKAKYSNASVNLKYQHTFEPSILSIGASFRNTAYNYYGNSFYPKGLTGTNPYDYNSKQSVNIFNFGIGLRSSEKNEGALKYIGNIGFSHFGNKYGPTSLTDGISGEQVDLGVNVFSEFDTDKTIGIDGSIMYQSFGKEDWFEYEDAYHKYLNVQGTPYIKFLGANWDVNLGANVNFLFDTKVGFSLAPNIKANVRINDVNKFYAEIGGGVNNNTFLDILQENRYVNPATRVEYSKILYDAKIGFSSGVVSGLEFDIFAGYKQTNKDHLYVYQPTGANDAWSLVGTPLYANVSTGHIGGQLKTALIPYTDLSAKITGYFYNVKYRDGYVTIIDPATFSEKKAWGRPSFTAELNADVKPIDKLTLSVNYLYAGGRKGAYLSVLSSVNPESKMKDINELNFRGEYQVTDWLSVNARLNNILYQRYELYYGHPLQGFNILGGVSLKF